MALPSEAVLTTLITAALLLPATPAAPAPVAHASAAACPHATRHTTPAREARVILCLINRERAQQGLVRLRASAALGSDARGYARTVVRAQNFSHTGPDGSTPPQRAVRAGYRGRGYGETLAFGQGSLGTPEHIVAGWMASPPHRAVLLGVPMRDVGVGVVRGSPLPGVSGGTTVVADFGYR